jgi:hypothetical protein
VLLRGHFATLIAVVMWTLSILAATAGRHVLTDQQERLVGIATVVSSIWALLQHYRGVRLKPGQMITSVEEMSRFEEAVMRSYREARDEQGGTRLRSAG